MSWACLHAHSESSLSDALPQPKHMIKRCVEVGIPALAITDHGSLGGTFSLIKGKKAVVEEYQKILEKADSQEEKDEAARKVEATKQLRTILGCELYLSPLDASIKTKENGKHSHLVVLSKNKEGWVSLLKLTANSNRPENFYRKPRISLDKLAQYTNGNLVTFSGHMGSDLANCIFTNIDLAYNAKTYEEAKALVDPNWKKNAFYLVGRYQEIFGKENFFIEGQRIDEENLPAAKVVYQALSFISKKTGVPMVATADAHYTTREDAFDQRLIVCNGMGTTFTAINQQLQNEDEDVGMGGFFKSNNYHIPTPEEMTALHTEDELKNSLIIADMCEDYDITARPSVPIFPCPHDLSSNNYLRQLCREGFKSRIIGKTSIDESKYVERIKDELAIWATTNILSDYFLITQDFVQAARAMGEYVGPSRGSAGGCLTNYLIGITGMDPLLYDLSSARFYNAGRNTKDRVSLPDIDCDFANPEKVFNYIQSKWGKDKVCRMGTFQRMMGRSALKDVLRIHGVVSAEEANRITEFIPDEAAISDQLQEMRNEGVEPSIIKWALQDHAKELKQWCFVNEKGNLSGPLAKYFAQAIRLEGKKRGMGRHASGVIIADFVLEERLPMVRDKSSDNLITGIAMEEVEAGGGAKFDVLGVQTLARISGVSRLLAGKRIIVEEGLDGD